MTNKHKVLRGSPFPLGATPKSDGTNFAIYASGAQKVELCLFDHNDDAEPKAVLELFEKTFNVWHGFVAGIKPGQRYGYKIHGTYKPEEGQRYNANKLLLDPNAKAISGTINWHESLYGYQLGNPQQDLVMSESDSTPFLPKSVVVSDYFDWENDVPPHIPYKHTIIYEAHVKGFTFSNDKIPEDIRGTYAAISHPETVKYLKNLGITAIELMPVHHFVFDHYLYEKGLTNYWGYSSIGFFAPDIRYASMQDAGDQVHEFKQMVKDLHKAGIEVILDVVYNHTAEGNHLGPTLCFKGIDNAEYYRLEENKRYYTDYTGTGNTLNVLQPNVLRLIMDSLRYWITEMHVDGFRFDLASTLARELYEVDRLGSFFDIIHQDPVISQVKLIAEPWDLGEGGYQVGNFPPGWAEWNGKYRDCVRDYWRGAESMLAEFANRFTGSADLYRNERYPTASINFVTAHDGFTLRDLVSYNQKHNEANKENNQDGEDHNRSWNCGVEGETDDPEVLKLRRKQVRNFLTTLLLSQGVPMISLGDEVGRTQGGNNNAYCQDNEISWLDWKNADMELFEFTKKLIRLRKEHPVFSQSRWLRGESKEGEEINDIEWFQPGGAKMKEENWKDDFAKSMAVFLYGKGIHRLNREGKEVVDDSFYIIFNAHHEPVVFRLPFGKYGKKWTCVVDTAENMEGKEFEAEKEVTAEGRSTIVLQTKRE